VGKGRVLFRKLFTAIHALVSFMSKLSDEERGKLLVELDKTIAEIKSLSSRIKDVTDKLGEITKVMSDYVFTHAYRMPGSYYREPAPWEPSNFDLSGLKKDYARLKELVAKRDGLEKQLGITIK
jgi:hypothetical protein